MGRPSLAGDRQHRHAIAIALLGVLLPTSERLKPDDVSVLSFDDVHAATSVSGDASCPITTKGATRTRAEQAHDFKSL